MRVRTASESGFPAVLLVHMGTVAEGDAFFARRWPEARAVSDPEQKLYADFELGRGSLRQIAGPAVWGRGLRTLLKGYGVGKPVGDPMQLSGHFLVRDGRIRWRDVHEHSGAAPRWDEIERVAAAP